MFVGIASAPVIRTVRLPDQSPFELAATPMLVEHAYTGVTASTIYVTPLGVGTYAIPGRKYLVYGREHSASDMVMASPGVGAKLIEDASNDLAFLDSLRDGAAGGMIVGTVQQAVIGPLAGTVVQIVGETSTVQVTTDRDGRFAAFVDGSGQYELIPQLPDGLTRWDPTSRILTVVREGGCATVTIDVIPDGRVRGMVRGPDHRPAASLGVDLIPMDVAPDPHTGHVAGTGSVSTDENGEFEFRGRPAGRYYLGVSLYNAPHAYGRSYPRTYYPGTTDRAEAIPVVIETGQITGFLEFSIPYVLGTGELRVTVDSAVNIGQLTLCVTALESMFGGRSGRDIQPGVPVSVPVVENQQYEVHVHLRHNGAHIESESIVLTATKDTQAITLRPDAPRDFHR